MRLRDQPELRLWSAEPAYQYDDAELRAAIEGTWSADVTHSDGSTVAFSLRLAQQTGTAGTAARTLAVRPLRERAHPSLVRAAHACGTRTLIASADACADATEMPLDVAFLARDSAL